VCCEYNFLVPCLEIYASSLSVLRAIEPLVSRYLIQLVLTIFEKLIKITFVSQSSDYSVSSEVFEDGEKLFMIILGHCILGVFMQFHKQRD